MKKIIILLLLVSFSFWDVGVWARYEEGYYGEYLLSTSKEKISMDLEGASLIDVLKVLSQQTGLNFVSSEAVRDRTLTLYLEKVPLRQALDTIFEANNLIYEFYPESEVFIVKESGKPTVELVTKVYYLKYFRIKSSKLDKEIDDAMQREEEGFGTTTTSGERDVVTQEGDVGIVDTVQNVLSEFGSISEDPQTNSLIVTDVPSQFPLIESVINSLDVPRPVVLIEVEMIDVDTRALDNFGVDWPEALIKLDVTGARQTGFPFSGGQASNTIGTFPETTSPGGTALTWPAGRFAPSILKVINAELALDFLKTRTDTKILARPKILTLANETAEIRITTDEAIGIKKTESESGDIEYEIERTETGTRLRVTPQVNLAGREITLMVEMFERNAKSSGFTATEQAFVSGTVKDPEERSAKALARLKDGEVLLLGGLIRTEVEKSTTKLPLLGDIPWLGWLFRHETIDNKERELLVFLTPHIIDDTAAAVARSQIPAREQTVDSRVEAIEDSLAKYQ